MLCYLACASHLTYACLFDLCLPVWLMLACLICTFLPYVCYSSYRSSLNSCFLITSVILSDERAALECEWLEQIVKDQSLLQRRFETSESGRKREMLLLLGKIDAVHQQRVRMRFVLLHSWLFLESTTNWSGFPEQIGYWPLCSFFEEPELSGRLRNEACHVKAEVGCGASSTDGTRPACASGLPVFFLYLRQFVLRRSASLVSATSLRAPQRVLCVRQVLSVLS